MTGKEFKEKMVKELGSSAAVAELFSTIPQNMNTLYNVADIKTGLLEKACMLMGKDMSFFYPMKKTEEIVNNNFQTATNVTGTGNIGTDQTMFLQYLMDENKRKDTTIQDLHKEKDALRNEIDTLTRILNRYTDEQSTTNYRMAAEHAPVRYDK